MRVYGIFIGPPKGRGKVLWSRHEKDKEKSLKLLWQLVLHRWNFFNHLFPGFSDPNFVSIGQHLNEFNTNWLLLLCGLCVLGFWLVQGVVLQHLTHTMH